MGLKKLAPFMTIFLLLFSLVPAQAQEGIVNLLSTAIPVIFIIAFILILLALGGVLPRGRFSRGMALFIVFILLIVLLFVLPMFIPYPQILEVPENFKMVEIPSFAAQFFIMLGLPMEWMYLPAIIYLFILPFAAIYTIVWAFLRSIEIFANVPSSVNRVLAFIIAFLTIPLGWFVKLVWVLFAVLGAWSLVIFAAIFILGVLFRGYGVVRREYTQILQAHAKVADNLQFELDELQKRVDNLTSEQIDALVNALASKYGGTIPKVANLAALVTSEPDVGKKREIIKNFRL